MAFKGMYGLPQAGLIANALLESRSTKQSISNLITFKFKDDGDKCKQGCEE
jgi:hypothetical protein